ncbi:hypothetical protein [Synechococcus sp. MIT S1220]|uniref:hypothetical protein n=1 Tax=Synechococcus sp. MIT S1220 TaxID=3082549 RepID=UPI0039AFB63E
MSKARDLVNGHLFPVLALVSTGTLIGIFLQLDAALSNDAQRSQQAKNFNDCVSTMMSLKKDEAPKTLERGVKAMAVRYCNGG